LVDMDGDGLPDRVNYDGSTATNQYQVQKNLGMQANGNGQLGSRYAFGPTSTGSGTVATNSNPIPAGGGYAQLNTPYGRIRDINGDGLPDRVMNYWAADTFVFPTPPYTPFTNYEVMLNNGAGFFGVSAWTVTNISFTWSSDPDSASLLYACVEGGGTYTAGTASYNVGVGLFDINGDGLPDRVMTAFDLYTPMTNLYVQINTGTKFSPIITFPHECPVINN